MGNLLSRPPTYILLEASRRKRPLTNSGRRMGGEREVALGRGQQPPLQEENTPPFHAVAGQGQLWETMGTMGGQPGGKWEGGWEEEAAAYLLSWPPTYILLEEGDDGRPPLTAAYLHLARGEQEEAAAHEQRKVSGRWPLAPGGGLLYERRALLQLPTAAGQGQQRETMGGDLEASGREDRRRKRLPTCSHGRLPASCWRREMMGHLLS